MADRRRERLSIGTICRKTSNRSPTHRLPGEIIFPEKLVQFLPILEMKSFSRRSIGYEYHKPVKVFIIGLSY